MALHVRKLKPDFGDAVAEAQACRTNCALFDFSFLESARLEGLLAESVIERLTARSTRSLREGAIFYALRVDGAGRTLSDLTIWRTGAQSFEVMSGRRQDILDLLAFDGSGLCVTDVGSTRAVFAVQGPATLNALEPLGELEHISGLKYFNFARTDIAGIPCTIGRLGYTGEAGFEIIVERSHAGRLWNVLAAHVRPAGFVAADMLRIEAGFVLFTNEFRVSVSPREAGLGKFYPAAWSTPSKLKLVSFRADADSLSWPWQATYVSPRSVGPGTIMVTSACDSVVAGGILGLGYVDADTEIDAQLHDPAARFRGIRLAPLPFYDDAKRRPRAPWR
jgi:aminomethyltransferase